MTAAHAKVTYLIPKAHSLIYIIITL